LCICIFNVCVCIYIYIYIHTHIQTYKHTYIHAYKHILHRRRLNRPGQPHTHLCAPISLHSLRAWTPTSSFDGQSSRGLQTAIVTSTGSGHGHGHGHAPIAAASVRRDHHHGEGGEHAYGNTNSSSTQNQGSSILTESNVLYGVSNPVSPVERPRRCNSTHSHSSSSRYQILNTNSSSSGSDDDTDTKLPRNSHDFGGKSPEGASAAAARSSPIAAAFRTQSSPVENTHAEARPSSIQQPMSVQAERYRLELVKVPNSPSTPPWVRRLASTSSSPAEGAPGAGLLQGRVYDNMPIFPEQRYLGGYGPRGRLLDAGERRAHGDGGQSVGVDNTHAHVHVGHDGGQSVGVNKSKPASEGRMYAGNDDGGQSVGVNKGRGASEGGMYARNYDGVNKGRVASQGRMYAADDDDSSCSSINITDNYSVQGSSLYASTNSQGSIMLHQGGHDNHPHRTRSTPQGNFKRVNSSDPGGGSYTNQDLTRLPSDQGSYASFEPRRSPSELSSVIDEDHSYDTHQHNYRSHGVFKPDFDHNYTNQASQNHHSHNHSNERVSPAAEIHSHLQHKNTLHSSAEHAVYTRNHSHNDTDGHVSPAAESHPRHDANGQDAHASSLYASRTDTHAHGHATSAYVHAESHPRHDAKGQDAHASSLYASRTDTHAQMYANSATSAHLHAIPNAHVHASASMQQRVETQDHAHQGRPVANVYMHTDAVGNRDWDINMAPNQPAHMYKQSIHAGEQKVAHNLAHNFAHTSEQKFTQNGHGDRSERIAVQAPRDSESDTRRLQEDIGTGSERITVHAAQESESDTRRLQEDVHTGSSVHSSSIYTPMDGELDRSNAVLELTLHHSSCWAPALILDPDFGGRVHSGMCVCVCMQIVRV
jgi:hypothetical protein